MRRIDPNTLYDGNEILLLLKGVVKIDILRQYGLVGSPGSGYWGQNVVDSLNNYWQHLVRQRGTGKVGKEKHLDSKPSSRNEVQDREIYAKRGKTGTVESERERFQRLVSENSIQREGFERSHANGGRHSSQSASGEA